MNQPRRITIKEIANGAGVSIGTVDRALSNRAGISKKTKATVLRIAKELGYTRNVAASALGRKRKLKIAIIYCKNPVDFYSYMDSAVKKATEDFMDYGIEIDLLQTEYLNSEQNQLLEQLNYTQYDAIAINAAGQGTTAYINTFVEAGVPVITFNSDAPDSKRLFFIGSNAHQSGEMAGELMGLLLGGRGRVAIIGNLVNIETYLQRGEGFREFLRQYFPQIEVAHWADYYTSPQNAYETIVGALRKNPDIDGVFSTGYLATSSIIKALETVGAGRIKFIGYDLSPQVLRAIKGGICQFSIFQDPYKQAYEALQMVIKYLTEAWVPPAEYFYVENKIILRSNAPL